MGLIRPRLPRLIRTDCRVPMPNNLRIDGQLIECTLGRWHREARHQHHGRSGGKVAHGEWETPRGADPITHLFELRSDQRK